MTDGELLSLLKEDDAAAFNTLFTRYWDRLHRTVVSKTGDSQAAFDIVQDVFVQVWQQRETLEIEIRETLLQYLSGIVRNKVFNYYRTNRRRLQQLKELTELLTAAPDTEYSVINVKEETEKERAWELAVDNLPGRMKEVYILRSRHQYSFRNIADTLKIKPQTAKNAFARAQELLREHFNGFLPPIVFLVVYSFSLYDLPLPPGFILP